MEGRSESDRPAEDKAGRLAFRASKGSVAESKDRDLPLDVAAGLLDFARNDSCYNRAPCA